MIMVRLRTKGECMNEVEFGKTLKDLNLLLFKVMNKRHKCLGLDITPIQSTIILAIYESKEKLCQKHLESFVSCNKSTLSSVLDTMEKKDFIKRKIDEKDTRKNVIVLTNKSKKILEILSKEREILEQKMMRDIEKKEQKQLQETLNKIKENLERI